jgi:glycosyltransferase involved in cell wall biosynthesis
MSTDETPRIVARFAAESTLTLRMVQNTRRKPAAAMNLGLADARGDVIGRVDGHAALASDYVSRGVAALLDTGADCAGGVIESEGDTFVGRVVALAMSSRFGVGGASFRTGGEGPADTVAFGLYRRDVFDRIGGFVEDIHQGEDDEFNYRLLDSGGRIVLVPELHARYTVRGSLPGVWRQYFGYGRAKVEVLMRHPSQARPRHLAPVALVVALGMSTVARGWPGKGLRRSIIGSYASGVALASVNIAARRGWGLLPVLPAAFVSLHVPYGLGTIAGIAAVILQLARGSTPEEAREGLQTPP